MRALPDNAVTATRVHELHIQAFMKALIGLQDSRSTRKRFHLCARALGICGTPVSAFILHWGTVTRSTTWTGHFWGTVRHICWMLSRKIRNVAKPPHAQYTHMFVPRHERTLTRNESSNNGTTSMTHVLWTINQEFRHWQKIMPKHTGK